MRVEWGGTSYLCGLRERFQMNSPSYSQRYHRTYIAWCFVWRWFFKLVVPPPWATYCLHSVQIVQLPLSTVVHFETKVFLHNGDMTGWRYDRDLLASILHVVTQFAHVHNWLGRGHLKPVDLQNTSYQLINRLTVTSSQHYIWHCQI